MLLVPCSKARDLMSPRYTACTHKPHQRLSLSLAVFCLFVDLFFHASSPLHCEFVSHTFLACGKTWHTQLTFTRLFHSFVWHLCFAQGLLYINTNRHTKTQTSWEMNLSLSRSSFLLPRLKTFANKRLTDGEFNMVISALFNSIENPNTNKILYINRI